MSDSTTTKTRSAQPNIDLSLTSPVAFWALFVMLAAVAVLLIAYVREPEISDALAYRDSVQAAMAADQSTIAKRDSYLAQRESLLGDLREVRLLDSEEALTAAFLGELDTITHAHNALLLSVKQDAPATSHSAGAPTSSWAPESPSSLFSISTTEVSVSADRSADLLKILAECSRMPIVAKVASPTITRTDQHSVVGQAIGTKPLTLSMQVTLVRISDTSLALMRALRGDQPSAAPKPSHPPFATPSAGMRT